jgi:hypothetical protein
VFLIDSARRHARRACYPRCVASDEDSPDFAAIAGIDLGEFVEELFDDVDRVRRVFQRAFPGTQPDADGVRLQRDKLRRAAPEPGPERIHRGTEAPEDSEREAAKLQEAARGLHTIYAVHARHHRLKPFESDWVGHVQAVRVTIPKTRPRTGEQAEPIWTYLGVVKAEDHFLFSVEEIIAGYAKQFGKTPKVERVDLITGARHYNLERFAPLSVFLAYERAEDKQPIFYVYESGTALGKPAALYWADSLGAKIVANAQFQFTPFSCPDDWYTGKLIMNRAKTEPSVLSISISQTKDGTRHYIDLTASYEIVEPGKVVWPLAMQIQAALRVFAIAQGMGCKLEVWEWTLGQVGRNSYDWLAEPPQRGKAQGYCSRKRD